MCAPVHGGLDVNGSRLLREVSFDVLAVIDGSLSRVTKELN